MGDHGFGVREVPGSNPGGTPIFKGVSFSYKHEVGLGLMLNDVYKVFFFLKLKVIEGSFPVWGIKT